jgi:predicted DNA-binding protein with PD1-like motif
MKIPYRQYQLGRRLLAGLPSNQDLIASVAELCRSASIGMAAFTVAGAVSAYTIGVFDQRQQVYVTVKESQASEIIVCQGHVSLQENTPFVYGHIAVCDEKGHITGGRLFSDTMLFVGEIDLQELLGDVLPRSYDPSTGRLLWQFT